VGAPGWVRVGMNMKNNQPVADRQTLTMAASQHPLPGTGPYRPPAIVRPTPDQPVAMSEPDVPATWLHLMGVLGKLYPERPPAVDPYATGPWTIANSQAIGDRPVTTMTNPLPGYRPPAMVNTPLAQQLRAMINHALAQRGLHPLINAPLPVGPTQMGRM
jgi:hypothetical protein